MEHNDRFPRRCRSCYVSHNALVNCTFKETELLSNPSLMGLLPYLNPLTPQSDQFLISFHSIILKSNVKVMKKKKNDHQFKKLLIVKQILLLSTGRNVERSVWRV